MKLIEIGSIAIILLCLAGNAYGIEQVYDSDLGKIKLDLPMTLISKSGNTGTWIDLVKQGSEKPVIAIRIQEPYGQDLIEYAASSGYKNPSIETTTNDGHILAYYTDGSGANTKYIAFINYLKDNSKIVQMWTYSKVNGKEGTIAEFNEDQVLEMFKSFAVI